MTVAVAVIVTVSAPTDRTEVGATVGVTKAWSSGLVCVTARDARDSTAAKRAIGAISISGVVQSVRMIERVMPKRNLISTLELCQNIQWYDLLAYKYRVGEPEYTNLQNLTSTHTIYGLLAWVDV